MQEHARMCDNRRNTAIDNEQTGMLSIYILYGWSARKVEVQNDGQLYWSYNSDMLVQIKKEMVKDKRYEKLDIDTIHMTP